MLTLVLEEVAHPGSSGKDKLGNILDNLGLLFRRQGGEPFRQALDEQSVPPRYRGESWSVRGNSPPCPVLKGE